MKSWLIWKDPDAGKDWRQEEKGTTEDEMVGWHHQLNGHGFGWTPGVGGRQGGLACCGSWGCKESDTTEWLNWMHILPQMTFTQRQYFFFLLYIHHLALRLQQTSPGGSSFRDGGLVDVCGPCPLFLPRQTAQKPPSLGPAQGSPVAPHGAWWATVHGVAKSRTQLSDSTVNNNMHIHIICTYIVCTHTHTHIYTQYQNTKRCQVWRN